MLAHSLEVWQTFSARGVIDCQPIEDERTDHEAVGLEIGHHCTQDPVFLRLRDATDDRVVNLRRRLALAGWQAITLLLQARAVGTDKIAPLRGLENVLAEGLDVALDGLEASAAVPCQHCARR